MGNKFKKLLNIFDSIEPLLTSATTFRIFSIVLILYTFFGLLMLYSPGGSDYWEHLATIYHLSTDPTDTSNAYIIASKPFFLNTPYHLFWGIVSKVLNIHPFWLLPLIGAINSFLFLTGVVLLTEYVTRARRYSLITALTLLFFWHKPWTWSGFYNFGTLPMSSIYPFWFALSLSLIIISKIGIQKGYFQQFIYVIVMALVFLIHPLTGSFLFLGVFVKSVTNYHEPMKNRLLVLLSPFAAFVLGMLWPYFSVGAEILKIGDSPRYFLGPYWQFYVQPWKSILPALFGFIYLPIALKNKQLNFVVIGLFATIVIFIGNRYTFHSPYLSRYLIYICFFLQISIVMLLKTVKNGFPRKVTFFVFFILLVIFGINQIRLSTSHFGINNDNKHNVPIGTHSNMSYFNKYSKISAFTSKTNIVFAPIYDSWKLPGIVGCRVVGSPHAEVFETDEEYWTRWDDTDIFFQNSTLSKTRVRIINKYNVDFLMIPKEFNYAMFDSLNILESVFTDTDYKFYKVKVD